MRFAIAILVGWAFFLLSSELNEAYSYVGPGVAITMLGALWAVLVAVVLALVGILLWPIRALIFRWRSAKTKTPSRET